jgi:hypothetical protein
VIQNTVNALVLGFAAHMIGDYVLQSDWMAQEKTKRSEVALLHALTYSWPFIPLLFLLDVQHPLIAILVIWLTHAVIDHYRLARHVVWFKNQFAPREFRPGHTTTGHAEDRPAFLTIWLVIYVDNIIHVAINTAALVWL